MVEEGDTFCYLCALPTEVLLYIFTFLPGRHLTRCRQVCQRWKHVIDGMTRSDVLWREHCRRDFDLVYKVARLKARVGLLWFNIYRSLSLWPLLSNARELRNEFASAENINDQITSFEVLKDGIIGIHKQENIMYYDIETLEPCKRKSISGDYMSYRENEDTIVIQSFHLHLFVIRKVLYGPSEESNATFDNVKTFLLVDKEIYFVTLENEIYVCNLSEDKLTATFIKRCEESIMCLGHNNTLQVLTFERNIFSVVKNDLMLTCELDDCPNLLHPLHQYCLLESLDWRVFFQWMCILRKRVPAGPLQEVLTVRVYGDMVFVGCNWGVLRIYHAPYTDGEIDFYNAEPVKQYNFMERSDCPVLTMCPIMKIDVLESEDGHTVIVAMPKKIAILDFIHCFKRSVSVAMLPYSDTKAKVLKLEKCI